MVITNESGVYQFASLQPGVYTLSAELTGFQTQVAKGVNLNFPEQARFNSRSDVLARTSTMAGVVQGNQTASFANSRTGAVQTMVNGEPGPGFRSPNPRFARRHRDRAWQPPGPGLDSSRNKPVPRFRSHGIHDEVDLSDADAEQLDNWKGSTSQTINLRSAKEVRNLRSAEQSR